MRSLPRQDGSNLRVTSWNVHSLTPARLAAFDAITSPVIALQEVWHPSEEVLRELGVRFDVHTRLREGEEGGGVAILVDRLLFASAVVPTPPMPNGVELIMVDIGSTTTDHTIRIASLYVVPTFAGNLLAVLQQIATLQPHLIVGDINARHRSWDHGAEPRQLSGAKGTHVARFTCQGWTLCNAPFVATTTSGSTLDLILARKGSTLFPHSCTVLGIAGSDHLPVEATLSCTSPMAFPRTQVPKVNWRLVTPDMWLEYGRAVKTTLRSWHRTGTCLEKKHRLLVEAMRAASSRFPRLPRRSKPNWNSVLEQQSKRVCQLFERARAAPPPNKASAMRKARVADRAFRKECLEWHNARIRTRAARTDDARRLWRFFKQEPIPPRTPLTHGTETWWGPQQQAEGLNTLFAEKCRTRTARPPYEPSTTPSTAPPFVLEEVRAAVFANPISDSIDSDNINVRHLRHLPPEGMEALRDLFQTSLDQGELPKMWKRSTCFALLKKEKPADTAGSYRPVSLTSCLCRSMERILQWRLAKPLCHNAAQYGFRKGGSSVLPVAHFSLAAMDGFRQKHHRRETGAYVAGNTLLMAFDFSDAFCSFAPDDCLREVEQRGVDSAYLRWLRAFLSGRSQATTVNGVTSKPLPTTWGGPQGSVLLPMLWNCMMDKLMRTINFERAAGRRGLTGGHAAFADDYCVWISGSKDPNDLRAAALPIMKQILSWCAEHGISVSTKSFARLLSSERRNQSICHPLKVDGFDLTLEVQQEPFKTLGIELDCDLHARPHFNTILDTMDEVVHRLASLHGVLHPSCLRTLYFGAGLGKALYGAQVWWPMLCASNKQSLEEKHAQAAKAILGLLPSTNSKAALAEAGMRSLDYLVQAHTIRTDEKGRRLPTTPAGKALAAPIPPLHTKCTAAADRPTIRSASHLYPLPAAPHVAPTLEPLIGDEIPQHLLTETPKIRIHVNPCLKVRASDPDEQKAAANARQLQRFADCDATIYSDGSAKFSKDHPTGTGACAATWNGTSRGRNLGDHTCSFTAEVYGLNEAIALTPEACRTPLFLLDGQSVLALLSRGPLRQNLACGVELWRNLLTLAKGKESVDLAFIFSHVGTNDEVDTKATHAHDLPPTPPPLSLLEATRVRTGLAKAAHDRTAKPCMGFRGTHAAPPCSRIDPHLTTRTTRLLAQMRCGVCPLLGGWRHEADEPDVCPQCATPLIRGGGTAIKHLFECPEAAGLRADLHLTTATSQLWSMGATCVVYLLSFLKEAAE
jgi:endonuclease/exonuclease/phosphatase family metal-dependent hydrolase